MLLIDLVIFGSLCIAGRSDQYYKHYIAYNFNLLKTTITWITFQGSVRSVK